MHSKTIHLRYPIRHAYWGDVLWGPYDRLLNRVPYTLYARVLSEKTSQLSVNYTTTTRYSLGNYFVPTGCSITLSRRHYGVGRAPEAFASRLCQYIIQRHVGCGLTRHLT